MKCESGSKVKWNYGRILIAETEWMMFARFPIPVLLCAALGVWGSTQRQDCTRQRAGSVQWGPRVGEPPPGQGGQLPSHTLSTRHKIIRQHQPTETPRPGLPGLRASVWRGPGERAESSDQVSSTQWPPPLVATRHTQSNTSYLFQILYAVTAMAFGLYSLLEAALLVLNAMCVLHEERFLAKVRQMCCNKAGWMGPHSCMQWLCSRWDAAISCSLISAWESRGGNIGKYDNITNSFHKNIKSI